MTNMTKAYRTEQYNFHTKIEFVTKVPIESYHSVQRINSNKIYGTQSPKV